MHFLFTKSASEKKLSSRIDASIKNVRAWLQGPSVNSWETFPWEQVYISQVTSLFPLPQASFMSPVKSFNWWKNISLGTRLHISSHITSISGCLLYPVFQYIAGFDVLNNYDKHKRYIKSENHHKQNQIKILKNKKQTLFNKVLGIHVL